MYIIRYERSQLYIFVIVGFFILLGESFMGQYFSNEKLKSKIKKYETTIAGHAFSFYTDLGVFCKDYLDFGTRLLLETINKDSIEGDLLDVGCGYGPMGIFALKNYSVKVTMIDVNRRALHLAKRNLKENQVEAIVLESDCYQNIDKKYDVIITNPPIRAGKDIVYKILFGAKDHLKEHGKLFLVIRKEQGAKSIISDLEKQYTVIIRNKKKGFYCLECNLPLTS